SCWASRPSSEPPCRRCKIDCNLLLKLSASFTVPGMSARLRLLRPTLAAATAALLLTSVAGAAPPRPDRPVPAAADLTWDAEPSAATLAAAGADRAGTPRGEQFYFALPDRFANGDPGNDRGGL